MEWAILAAITFLYLGEVLLKMSGVCDDRRPTSSRYRHWYGVPPEGAHEVIYNGRVIWVMDDMVVARRKQQETVNWKREGF